MPHGNRLATQLPNETPQVHPVVVVSKPALAFTLFVANGSIWVEIILLTCSFDQFY